MIAIFQRPVRLVLLLLTLTVSITAHAQDALNWTGFYLGGNGGGNFAHYDIEPHTDSVMEFPGFFSGYDVFDFSKTRETYIGGGQIGYNYQLGPLVLGLEGDFDGASSSNARLGYYSLNVDNPFYVFRSDRSVEMNWNASARLRAGYAWGRFLLYGTGGGAFTHLDVHAKDGLPPDPRFSVESSDDHTVAGWAAGAGVDWAVTKAVTIGLEYRHSGIRTE